MVNPEPDQAANEDWDVEYIVIFRPERGGQHRIQLVRLDAEILGGAEAGGEMDRRAVCMTVGRAFRVRPSRITWNQLFIFPPP